MPGQPDQQEITPPVKSPEVSQEAREITRGILDMFPKGEPFKLNAPQLVSGVLRFYQSGEIEKPPVKNFVESIASGIDVLDPKGEIAQDVITRFLNGYGQNDKQAIIDSLILIDLLGVENNPRIKVVEEQFHIFSKARKNYLTPKEVTPAPVVEPVAAVAEQESIFQKPITRRDLLSKYAPALALTAMSSGLLGILYAKNRSEEIEKGPIYLFTELIKPFIDKALAQRAERAKNDPEYSRRIDPELNSDRINFLFFGYGLTSEPPFTGKIGSPTVYSINLKDLTVDMVSLTHDVRDPRTERYLAAHGEKPTPTRIDQAYWVGGEKDGFNLMRETMENATGFAVDFQIVAPDEIIKHFIDNVTGKIEVDIPFNIDTQPYFLEDKLVPGGSFKAGKAKLNGTQVIQFMKAMSEGYNKATERNVRKKIITEALLKTMKRDATKLGFLWGLYGFLNDEGKAGNLKTDFDVGQILTSHLGDVIKGFSRLAVVGAENIGMPSMGKSVYIVDGAFGDGGVQWITADAVENPITKKDIENGVYPDLSLEIPYKGNPYDQDLTRYYQSVRSLIKKKLHGK